MELPLHLHYHVEKRIETDLHPQAWPRRWVALWFICLAILISALDMTTLNVALPQISRTLHASTSELQWIVDAYTLVLAGFLLLGSGLGDRYGRKGVFLTGVILFGVATLAAAFSVNPAQLIIARGVMGIGAALFLPAALSIIAVLFPPGERAKAIAVWAWCGCIGTALGPVIAGLFVDDLGWPSVFVITVPVVAVAAVGVALLAPTSRSERGQHLDIGGAALSVLGLSILIFGLIQAPEHGWTSPTTLGTIAVGAAFIAGFVIYELRNPYPMFDVRVFCIGPVLAGAVVLFLAYVCFLGMLFLVPQYLQFVRGFDSLHVGLLMLPFGAAVALTTIIAPRALKRLGSREVLATSVFLAIIALVILSSIGHERGEGLVLIGEIVLGMALGCSFAPATTTVMNALPVEKAGDGSSVNQIVRQVGAAFGVAIVGSAFSAVFAIKIAPALVGVPAETADLATSSIGAAEHFARSLEGAAGEALALQIRQAFAAGARVAFAVVAAMAVLTLFVVLLALRRAPEPVRPQVAATAGIE